MHSAAANAGTVRQHAQALLASIGVSRIIVVDDEYSAGRFEVEELLGICSALDAAHSAKLPHLDGIDFEADREIWADVVRDRWGELDEVARRSVLTKARALEAQAVDRDSSAELGGEEQPRQPGTAAAEGPQELVAESAVEERQAAVSTPEAGDTAGAAPVAVDVRAAESLEEILSGLEECEFVALSLTEWKQRADELLTDDKAATTVFLFDRDFSREQEGAEDEGFKLVREVQSKKVGYCGLISHRFQRASEYEAWHQLAEQHSLVRDKFVVIAKERLTGEPPDHYSFLRMLRLAALCGRCAGVKETAWAVFEASVSEAKAAMERLSVIDFDRVVFASSRREGVWEPDTLFRVFGIFMRREARLRLYQDEVITEAVTEARRVSAIPEEVAPALGEEGPSREALRIQRFETYESDDTLNRFCLPIELGDIFEKESTGRHYILLAQPCDLMVRRSGKRSYEDDKLGRTGALVELRMDCAKEDVKEGWAEVPFYDQDTGAPAYADFAKAHQVQLAVLDLCALRTDGVAVIETDGRCPELLIESWRKRCARLQKFFAAAVARYQELANKQVKDELKLLALPAPSATLRLPATVDGKTLLYGFKRVMRLRQPRSGALLTAFAQHQARAAFEHPFDHRVPMQVEANDEDPAEGEDAGGAE